jgi:putative FmdB family regulatory protein
MPIYEYKCNACGKEFEYQQRMSDPEKTDCEACGKPALERLISRTAFTLKGGGWYKDLYSSTKPGDSATKSDAKPASSDSSSSASSSSDSSSSSSSTPSSSSTGSGTSGGGASGGGGGGTSGSGGSGSSGSGSSGSGSKAAASAS